MRPAGDSAAARSILRAQKKVGAAWGTGRRRGGRKIPDRVSAGTGRNRRRVPRGRGGTERLPETGRREGSAQEPGQRRGFPADVSQRGAPGRPAAPPER